MKLDTEFRKLPLRFDAERLVVEAAQFTEADWRAHPQGHAGNSAVPLIAAHGDPSNDGVRGPMRPTPLLEHCPYVRQVLASLGAVLGRTRLMRIAGQGEATAHVDTNYYWMQRVPRVHVPIATFPEVEFVCGGRALHMAAGECWIFDTWRLHNVLNPNARDRIHLVADTVGSATFWDLAAQAERPFADDPGPPLKPRLVPYQAGRAPQLDTETVNFPVVMSPWEQECMIVRILEDLRTTEGDTPEQAARLEAMLEGLHRQWRALWAQHGDGASGWPAFEELQRRLDGQLEPFAGKLTLTNELDMVEALRQVIVRPALSLDLVPEPRSIPTTPAPPRPASEKPRTVASFDRPVFIVAAPRSGSTFLFETLARSPDVWTVGGESHEVFESFAKLDPLRRGFDSNRLTAADYDGETARALREKFLSLVRNRAAQPPPESGSIRLLEKTPKNALRVPFLDAVFPEARFIYLYREPRENLSSIIDAWKSGRFVTYPRLPDWEGPPWSLLLIPEWRRLIGKPLAEIAAVQWTAAHRCILDDLSVVPAERWCAVAYADLVANPSREIERLCKFAGVSWDQDLSGPLPLSRYTLTPPDPNKWGKNAAALKAVLPGVEATAERARRVVSGGAAAGGR